uniref:Uncharacterized protein n=1 Tax=Arundo donax TaxID=35708 RepID=A0A0A9BRZ1_ARUDO
MINTNNLQICQTCR